MFKYILILSAVFTGILSEHPIYKHHKEECAKEFGLDVSMIRNDGQLPENKKCFYKCMAQKIGMMNEKNEITLEAFKSKLVNNGAPQKFISAVENCKVKEMQDPCDTAVALRNCIKQQ